VDLDVASLKEIERLPRIGPGLAKKIVADRAARGAFGSLNGLDRVPGVGAALLGVLAPHVRFSGRDGIGGSVASVGSVASTSSGSFPVNLNSASPAALQRLPGIGATRAQAIVAYREAHGPFASIEALAKVPGIGPSIVKRINGLAIAE
jgi:competence protein ComEA